MLTARCSLYTGTAPSMMQIVNANVFAMISDVIQPIHVEKEASHPPLPRFPDFLACHDHPSNHPLTEQDTRTLH